MFMIQTFIGSISIYHDNMVYSFGGNIGNCCDELIKKTCVKDGSGKFIPIEPITFMLTDSVKGYIDELRKRGLDFDVVKCKRTEDM